MANCDLLGGLLQPVQRVYAGGAGASGPVLRVAVPAVARRANPCKSDHQVATPEQSGKQIAAQDSRITLFYRSRARTKLPVMREDSPRVLRCPQNTAAAMAAIMQPRRKLPKRSFWPSWRRARVAGKEKEGEGDKGEEGRGSGGDPRAPFHYV